MIPINKKPATGGPMPKPGVVKPGVAGKPTGVGQSAGGSVSKKMLPAKDKQNQINKNMLAKAYAKRSK